MGDKLPAPVYLTEILREHLLSSVYMFSYVQLHIAELRRRNDFFPVPFFHFFRSENNLIDNFVVLDPYGFRQVKLPDI